MEEEIFCLGISFPPTRKNPLFFVNIIELSEYLININPLFTGVSSGKRNFPIGNKNSVAYNMFFTMLFNELLFITSSFLNITFAHRTVLYLFHYPVFVIHVQYMVYSIVLHGSPLSSLCPLLSLFNVIHMITSWT